MIRFALVAMLLALEGGAAADPKPPADLLGTWDVDRVAVDLADQMHWAVPPDDPQLIGRELVISRESVHFTADKEGCRQASWKPLVTTWGGLFDKGFRRPAGGGRSTRPSTADFAFAVSNQAPVTAYLLCPTADRKPADAWLQAKWVALQGSDTLAMHYSNQVLLILKRRPPVARPRASFPCEKAVTPTEQAICSSFELAGWDRSVAAAWRQALERRSNTQPTLRAEQKKWLRKRDSCGAEVKCLDALLWRRVEELTQE